VVLAGGPAAGLGHVRALTLVARPAPGGERLVAVGVVEARLLLEQVGAARVLADGRHGLRGEVEVRQVLVRDHPDAAQPLAAEQRALLEARERGVVGQQAGEQVAGAVADGPQPAEVVEAEVVEPQLAGGAAECSGRAAAQPRRRVADAHGVVAHHLLQRLGDHARGVGEVDQPRARCARLHGLGERDHARDRAQREADAAGPGGLLPEHAERERHRLVDDAALELARADRAEHEVGPLHGVVEVGGGAERQAVAVLGRLLLEDPGDPL
jgi:hypothetical protein